MTMENTTPSERRPIFMLNTAGKSKQQMKALTRRRPQPTNQAPGHSLGGLVFAVPAQWSGVREPGSGTPARRPPRLNPPQPQIQRHQAARSAAAGRLRVIHLVRMADGPSA